MRALFDSSFLISFFDVHHIFHDRASAWYGKHRENGWATCPMTQNAVLRIVSKPAYSSVRSYSLVELRDVLRQNVRETDHEFWFDDVSLLDDSRIRAEYIIGPNQLTDVYLLALAVKNGGRLVTFDERISIQAVSGATPDNLVIV